MSKIKEFDGLNIANYIDNAFGVKGTGYTVKEKATLLFSSDILNMLDHVKKDAWNAAIKWAAENACGLHCTDYVDKESIINGLIED